ncbi:MAG: hypothetical protein VYD90_10905 [Pseudomonadota bacterium]|nr:hypothetical protein [Pseudomonadota bacterium]
MSVKHTPGPWYVEDGEKGVWVNSDALASKGIAVVVNYCGDEARRANAQLLAAAPELLEALEEAELHLRDFANVLSYDPVEADEARVAIAKARGEA